LQLCARFFSCVFLRDRDTAHAAPKILLLCARFFSELGDSDSKKRKFPVSLDGTTATASPTAMDFDDGNVCFDYYSKIITNKDYV
jgi:hypothetical protein